MQKVVIKEAFRKRIIGNAVIFIKKNQQTISQYKVVVHRPH